MSRAVRWVIDTAGSVTGTRFRLVMASSATATALIIGSTLASGGTAAWPRSFARRWRRWAARRRALRRPPRRSRPRSPRPRRRRGGSLGPVSPIPVTGPSAPATSPAKTPKTKAPKAGRVKHVFVIALDSPGFNNAFGAQSEMPYLANTLRPQGELLSNYTLLDRRGPAELHRDGRWAGRPTR